MRAVVLRQGHCIAEECPVPECKPGEVLVKVAYAGVNRADLLQKQGKYPLPDQTPAIPGLEVAGEIVAFAQGASSFKIGDKVCALLSQGGYGEYVAVPSALVLPLPGNLTLEVAAGLPEACFTVWISLVWQARIAAGETVLIHGGASGIGSLAIQIARFLGARAFATAGSAEKCALCERLGAEQVIAYRTQDYVAAVKDATSGKGVDVILDMVGGDYFERNLRALAPGGRLCIIAFQQGAKVVANLAPLLLQHLSIMGSTLRPRPLAEKAQIARELQESLWEAVGKGGIKPVIDRIFPLEEAEKALLHMEQGLNLGKILLKL